MKKNTPKELTADEKKKVVFLRKTKGLSIKAIAKQLHICDKRISAFVNSLGAKDAPKKPSKPAKKPSKKPTVKKPSAKKPSKANTKPITYRDHIASLGEWLARNSKTFVADNDKNTATVRNAFAGIACALRTYGIFLDSLKAMGLVYLH